MSFADVRNCPEFLLHFAGHVLPLFPFANLGRRYPEASGQFLLAAGQSVKRQLHKSFAIHSLI